MKIFHNNKFHLFFVSVILFIVVLLCAGCFYSYNPCDDEDSWEEECFFKTEKNENYGDGTLSGKEKFITIEYCYRYCLKE